MAQLARNCSVPETSSQPALRGRQIWPDFRETATETDQSRDYRVSNLPRRKRTGRQRHQGESGLRERTREEIGRISRLPIPRLIALHLAPLDCGLGFHNWRILALKIIHR